MLKLFPNKTNKIKKEDVLKGVLMIPVFVVNIFVTFHKYDQ